MGTSGHEDEVTVLLATYNGARFISEQLESIAAQSHENWRLVVSDDGSADETLDIVRSFARRHSSRVTLLEPAVSRSAKSNFLRLLAQEAPSPYFALCDQDDVWHPAKLAQMLAACQAAEAESPRQPVLTYSDLRVVADDRTTIDDSFLRRMRVDPHQRMFPGLLVENSIPGCAMLFNAALARLHRESLPRPENVIMHDWWLALLASATGAIRFVPDPLIEYRQHETNTLGAVDRASLALILRKMFGKSAQPLPQTWAQAAELIRAHGAQLPSEKRSIVEAYASSASRNKVQRIGIIVHHRIFKQGLLRKAFQLLRA